jgi:hypothetical protein
MTDARRLVGYSQVFRAMNLMRLGASGWVGWHHTQNFFQFQIRLSKNVEGSDMADDVKCYEAKF